VRPVEIAAYDRFQSLLPDGILVTLLLSGAEVSIRSPSGDDGEALHGLRTRKIAGGHAVSDYFKAAALKAGVCGFTQEAVRFNVSASSMHRRRPSRPSTRTEPLRGDTR